MTYRPDIDGLRAIAVLAVVIFHLGVAGFEGGFIGVDVFFVISGYLITSIIQRQHAEGRFSFADFYARRTRRLLPPLIATVFATTLACAAILEPYDMIAYGRSAVAALFSVSNILFFSEAGYWDTASELKPLLHTWSLGLEEQFYLLWPALIVGLLAWRGPRGIALPLLCIAVAGAALCIAYTAVDAAAAFYLLPFRVFQFALGALMIPLAGAAMTRRLLQSRSGHTGMLATGLAMVLVCVFAFDAETAFPGWAVLVPSLGAALVMLAGSRPGGASTSGEPDPLARLLNNPVSLWVGRASYALYLVHWPIVALYRYETGQAPTAAAQVLLALATIAATVLLHYGVERRFYQRDTAAPVDAAKSAGMAATERQQRKRPLYRHPVAGIVASLVLVALLPLNAWLGDGWSWREPDVVLSADAIDAGMQRRYTHVRGACPIEALATHAACDRTRPVQVLVFGNSHEPDGYNFLHAGYAGEDINLIRFGTTNQCSKLTAPGPGKATGVATDGCDQRLAALFTDDIVASLDAVVYSANKPFAGNKA
ncbi:MAG: acyltransferase, partial [Chromatocurvus sp.]